MNSVPRPMHTIGVLEPDRGAKKAFPKGAHIVKIGRDNNIEFILKALDTYNYKGWERIHHDLLVVSGAVEYADRKYSKCVSRGWVRDFNITIPVFELDAWQQDAVQQSLCAALKHLTGDNWQFSFIQWHGDPLAENQQRGLPFDSGEKKFTIAYSDGVDSRCVSELCDYAEKGVRVRLVANQDKPKKNDQAFDQIPFKVKFKGSSESSVRSRGFKFAAITAIAAHISGARKIVVPESGQGALGPVLLPLHNVYADYRNHPTYFRKIETFIEALLGFQVKYEQPRLWFTKGQTIKAFLEKSNNSRDAFDAVKNTRSCWQVRHNVFYIDHKRQQCGLCAACLLRRMSMHAVDIREREQEAYLFYNLSAEDYTSAVLKRHKEKPTNNMIDYGIAGAYHLQQLANMAKLSDKKLRMHVFELAEATKISEERALKQLKALLRNHAREWDDFLGAQGEKSFLRRWVE